MSAQMALQHLIVTFRQQRREHQRCPSDLRFSVLQREDGREGTEHGNLAFSSFSWSLASGGNQTDEGSDLA